MGMNKKNRYMFHWDWKEKKAVVFTVASSQWHG